MSLELNSTPEPGLIIPPETVTADLAALERCSGEAVRAVIGLWHQATGTFWRSTEQRSRELPLLPQSNGGGEFYPTVTFRSVDALLSFAGENPDWVGEDIKERIRNEIVPSVSARPDEPLASSLDVGGILNVFTLAAYVRAQTQLCRWKAFASGNATETLRRLGKGVADLTRHPALAPIGRTGELAAHPFLLYHVVRALADARPLVGKEELAAVGETMEKLRSALRAAVERLLAKKALGSGSPSDAVALGFCAGALLFDSSREDIPYALAALEGCLDAQDATGCWPLGRVVRENKDIANDRIEIPTYEIAEVVAGAACMVLQSLRPDGDIAILRRCVEHLRRAAAYTERSIVRLPVSAGEPAAGWCTDHAYGAELVESWTSATVLFAVGAHRRLLQELRRRQILATFTTVSPDDRSWPSWLRWNSFRSMGETDHAYPVLAYLERAIVSPVLTDPRKLPPSGDLRSVSALLFGPPGTAKTTLVKAIADALGWPVVLLSPGNFIEKGLEYIEAQSRSVFTRLLELSQAVVIFDECDELFRDRTPRPDTEQTRGITAFVTASMLPKLQELHDRGRVIFFICTNHFDAMDAAIKRGGRIDHIVGVGPPDKEARLKILGADGVGGRAATTQAHLGIAIEELAALTDRFTRNELQRAMNLLKRSAPWATVEEAKEAARSIVERLRGGLIISVAEYARHRELCQEFSRPVLEGRVSKSEPGKAERSHE